MLKEFASLNRRSASVLESTPDHAALLRSQPATDTAPANHWAGPKPQWSQASIARYSCYQKCRPLYTARKMKSEPQNLVLQMLRPKLRGHASGHNGNVST